MRRRPITSDDEQDFRLPNWQHTQTSTQTHQTPSHPPAITRAFSRTHEVISPQRTHSHFHTHPPPPERIHAYKNPHQADSLNRGALKRNHDFLLKSTSLKFNFGKIHMASLKKNDNRVFNQSANTWAIFEDRQIDLEDPLRKEMAVCKDQTYVGPY